MFVPSLSWQMLSFLIVHLRERKKNARMEKKGKENGKKKGQKEGPFPAPVSHVLNL